MTAEPARDWPRLLGVVLCGGRSSRMGQEKSLLPHSSGRTYVLHAVERLRAVCDGIAVSISNGQPMIRLHNVVQIQDPISHQGPIVGVVEALEYAERQQFAGCFCTAVDLPDLTADDLRSIRDAWRRSCQRPACGVDSQSGQIEPLVAIYPVALRGELRSTAISEDRSMYRWLAGKDPIRVQLSAGASRNVNAPGDL
jgi:molybdenum cofactor guanylyltransferase